jgi:antirestriction protein ArdC
MRQFFNQPVCGHTFNIGPHYAEQSKPFGHAYQAASAPRGINRRSALWVLCRYRHNGHWTAHPTRLGRDLTGRFGSTAYAREELIAELTSAFLCAHLGIIPQVRHADYLANWLAVLKSDNRAIFHAASQASKAADFVLAVPQQVIAGTSVAA